MSLKLKIKEYKIPISRDENNEIIYDEANKHQFGDAKEIELEGSHQITAETVKIGQYNQRQIKMAKENPDKTFIFRKLISKQ